MFFDMSSIHLLKLIRVCPAKEAGVSIGLFVKTNAIWVTKTLIILNIKGRQGAASKAVLKSSGSENGVTLGEES